MDTNKKLKSLRVTHPLMDYIKKQVKIDMEKQIGFNSEFECILQDTYTLADVLAAAGCYLTSTDCLTLLEEAKWESPASSV